MTTKVLPSIIILLMAASSIIYALAGDWRRTVFWAGAAVVNSAMTY